MRSTFLAALVFVLCLATSIPAHAWVTEALDRRASGGSAGPPALIAIDSADALHIVSMSYQSSSLFETLQYSTNASGSWETTLVVDKDRPASEGHTVGWVSPASVAVDSSDKVHFLYGIGTSHYHEGVYNVELKYATEVSGSWVTEDVGSGNAMYAFMALDSSDKAHISYDDCTTGQLKYATNASGSWVITVVDSDLGYYSSSVFPSFLPVRGAELSVAVDSSDKVHISYCEVTNEDLKYATNASGAWVTTTVDSAGSVGRHTSIALDSSNKVHISYYDATNDALKHATNASGSWVTEPVDSGLGYSGTAASRCTSIAVDGSDKVHINYYDLVNEAQKYATNASGAWVLQTVESGLEKWFWGSCTTSMVLDSSDNAHISYLDAMAWLDADLKHATNASGSWETEVVPSAALMGGVAVAVDSLGKSHVGYTGENVKYATDASGSWVTEVVDPVEGGDISIALDTSDKAHIAYSGGGFLRYATNASGSWVTTYLGSLGDSAALSISIALDTSDKAHVSFINTYPGDWCQHYDLWYATNASESWLWTKLESSCSSGENPRVEGNSIAVDSLDRVHITYGYPNLMYATNQSGSWSKTSVATGFWYPMPSIAVDSLDKVHISYVGSAGLMYATNQSGSWSHSFVAAGTMPSIAVDTLDKVHISYTSSSRTMYATSFGSSWVNMIASERPPLGCVSLSSIAVTPQGSVRIGHLGYDGTSLLTASSPCVDNDGDGYGDPASPECPYPAWDCDDTHPQVPSGLPEGPFGDSTCSDTLDNDCDGAVDGADSGCCECIDNDSDGYGSPGCENCTYPERDCNDSASDVNPGVPENCSNGIDDDCDGKADALDADCSSYSAAGNAEASMYGSNSVVGSGVFNEVALLLIPVGAIIVLRVLRRRN